MGLFSGLFGAVGKVVSGLLGRKDAKEANQMSWDQMLHQNAFNADEAKKAFQRNIKGVRFQDRLNDRNTRLAQRFQAREAAKSRLATDRAAVRARKWGVQDYRQQKADMADQFVRLRRAAKKGGFNPLTALGSAIIPNPAGGITSSSYAAAAGVGAAPVSAPGASSAMGGYGQPIAVPSLASNEAIMGGINELGRELSGEAAVERANAQLYHDIAKVELEQMKARLPQPVVPDFGNLGKQAVPQGPVAAVPSGWSLGGAGAQQWQQRRDLDYTQSASEIDAVNPREEVLEPMRNESGMIKVDSDWVRAITGGVPAYIPTVNDETVGGEFLGPIMGIGGAALNNRVWRPLGEWLKSGDDGSSPERLHAPSLGGSYPSEWYNNPRVNY